MYYYRNLIIAKRVIIYFAAATFVGCNFTVRAVAMLITVGLLTIFHTMNVNMYVVFHHTKFHALNYAGPLHIPSGVVRFLVPGASNRNSRP